MVETTLCAHFVLRNEVVVLPSIPPHSHQIRLRSTGVLPTEDVNVSTCLEMAERAIQQADDLANHRPLSRGVLPVGRAAPAVVVDPGILDRCASLLMAFHIGAPVYAPTTAGPVTNAAVACSACGWRSPRAVAGHDDQMARRQLGCSIGRRAVADADAPGVIVPGGHITSVQFVRRVAREGCVIKQRPSPPGLWPAGCRNIQQRPSPRAQSGYEDRAN